MSSTQFQPFSDRLSRDIRNDLSSALVEVLQTGEMQAAEDVAGKYLSQQLHQTYTDYIQKRLQAYSRILEKQDRSQSDPLYFGLLLWDEGLFFEVHEVLEHAWLNAEGEEKLFLQAMIRAAGVYIKLQAGYPDPATKIAAKAYVVLERNRDRLAVYSDPDVLLQAMKDLSQAPPTLLR